MREIDRKAIEEHGVASLDLMERAGAGAAHVIAAQGLEKGSKVVALCGKGNNGGDGFVAARYLKEWGAEVIAWVLGERDELSSDALRNLVAAEGAGVAIRTFHAAESDGEVARDLTGARVAIDALLGTGATGELRDAVRRLAQLLNETDARVYCLDMPTGMDADSGHVDPDCVHAAMTVTFGFPKRGLYTLPGRDLCGDITVIDLGYPEESVDVTTGVLLWQEMRNRLAPRDPGGHKGTFGRAVVIAGSRGMIGAACLAADSALRAGTGLVKLLVPASLADVCAIKLTEVMVHGLPDEGRGRFGPGSLEAAAPFLDEADAVLLGPGLGGGEPLRAFVRGIVGGLAKPLVLDADGLNAVAADGSLPERPEGAPLVITPHPGELARLLDRPTAELQADRMASARTAAARFGAEVVFKGAPTVIASPDGTADLCSLGNDGMATAGTGDVLAGLLAGLLAQGVTGPDAARLGAMVHGRAGDICRGELGARGMLAGDLVRCLPYAWRELEESAEDWSASASPEEEDDEE
jgi:NAD(P)H-hydrate epimerase